MHMGQILYEQLTLSNLSQAQLAKKIRRTPQQVSCLIRTEFWRINTVHRIAEALRVPVNLFLPSSHKGVPPNGHRRSKPQRK